MKKYECAETEVSTITLLSIPLKSSIGKNRSEKSLVQWHVPSLAGCFASGKYLVRSSDSSQDASSTSFAAGVHLIHLREQDYCFLGRFKEYGQNNLTIWLVPVPQVLILHFTGVFSDWHDAATLTRDLTIEDKYLAACDQATCKAL
jgi:hypothetical protein